MELHASAMRAVATIIVATCLNIESEIRLSMPGMYVLHSPFCPRPKCPDPSNTLNVSVFFINHDDPELRHVSRRNQLTGKGGASRATNPLTNLPANLRAKAVVVLKLLRFHTGCVCVRAHNDGTSWLTTTTDRVDFDIKVLQSFCIKT